MDHADLVAELNNVQQLSANERLRLAHRLRNQQLKQWAVREKELAPKRRRLLAEKTRQHRIQFGENVALLEAAARNDLNEVKKLLSGGINPNLTNVDGVTALHQSCIDDNEEMVKLLLSYNANVNAVDSERWTPLHAAATCGHIQVVRHLINKGANLLAVNADGNMPYDICEDGKALAFIEAAMAKQAVTQELIEKTRAETEVQMLADVTEMASQGHDLEHRDSHNATLLHTAAANGYRRVLEFLLDHHVSTDARDDDGWQPIHAAACWGGIDVLEMLVQSGADLKATTNLKETPAEICEDPELRERIIELQSEQEVKRLQEEAKRPFRRSQSTNSRTESVRRKSSTNKSLTSKKEAMQEAKLRLEEQEENENPGELKNKAVFGDVNSRTQEVTGHRSSVEPDFKEAKVSFPFLKRDTMGEVVIGAKEMEHLVRKSVEGQESVKNELESKAVADEAPKNTGASMNGNRNIDIMVSVTINAGTLSDLKKQRALARFGADSNSNSSTASAATVSLVERPFQTFSGPPANEDIVIGKKSRRRCVIL